MRITVKSAIAFLGGLALTLALTSAHAKPQKIDFDQGVDSARILESLRRQTPITSIDVGTLIPARTAGKETAFSKIGPLTGIDTSARVENSEPYAAALEYPPLVEVLEPADRDPLREEWKGINTERAGLLAEADALETEDWQLYDRAVAIDANAERLNDRQERLVTEIDNFNRQCTGRPLPPDEYNACLRWQTDLQQRIREHNAEVAQHNDNVEQWRREAADLRNRVGTALNETNEQKNISFILRVTGWEQKKIVPFIDRAADAIRRAQMTSVRVQAQGGGLELSVRKNELRAVTLIEGNSMLDELWLQLSPRQQEQRIFAFAQARAFMRETAAVGGVTAPPIIRRSFYNQNPNPPDARVDVEIFRGRAFVSAAGIVR
jgi:hypothetical protein